MKKTFSKTPTLAVAFLLMLAPASFALQGDADSAAQAHRELGAPTVSSSSARGANGPSLVDLVVGFLLGTVYTSDVPVSGADSGQEPGDKGPVVDPVGQRAP